MECNGFASFLVVIILGFSLGFLPLLIASEKGLYKTIEYVETFVEQHYLQQIHWIEKSIAKELVNSDSFF